MLPCGLTPRAVDARVLYMSPSSKNRSACLEPYAASSLTEVYDRLVAPHLDAQIDSWLAEDLGEDGDLTTDAFVPPDVEARAELCCREPGILSGLPVVMRMLQLGSAQALRNLAATLAPLVEARAGAAKELQALSFPKHCYCDKSLL